MRGGGKRSALPQWTGRQSRHKGRAFPAHLKQYLRFDDSRRFISRAENDAIQWRSISWYVSVRDPCLGTVKEILSKLFISPSKIPLGRQRLRPWSNPRDIRVFLPLAPRSSLGLLAFGLQPACCLLPLFLLACTFLCPFL